MISGSAVEQKLSHQSDSDSDEDELYGNYYLELKDLEASQIATQCDILDPVSIEKKIEHKLTHRFEKRMEILKLSIQDRDSVIAKYVEDIK